MDSGARILAKRYARAYMDLDGKAHDAGLEKAAAARLDALRLVAEETGPHMKVLTHPAINAAVKQEALEKILGRQTGPAAAFAALLVREGRFGLLPDVMNECLRLNDDFCGVLRAEVCSRYPLSEGGAKKGAELLAQATGKKVVLRQVLSDRVIGGFEVKVGDVLIDATVRGRLNELKSGLLGR